LVSFEFEGKGFGFEANPVFGRVERVEGGGEVEVKQGGDKTSALELKLETPTILYGHISMAQI
jgi:hypothetical protein